MRLSNELQRAETTRIAEDQECRAQAKQDEAQEYSRDEFGLKHRHRTPIALICYYSKHEVNMDSVSLTNE